MPFMNNKEHHLAFGPVPSRRLGMSLGLNIIPAKTCSYGCVYCQIGATTEKTIEPRAFFEPAKVADAAAEQVRRVRVKGGAIDYLSFVPDGEPTLDVHLGETIAALEPLGIPIAVITNGSLLHRPEVRRRLAGADWVSVKVDTVDEAAWRRVNGPKYELEQGLVLEGVQAFAREYGGTLMTDTMLIEGLNDGAEQVAATAAFIAQLAPRTAYIGVPTRPTAERAATGASESALTRAYEVFSARVSRVELLIGHEGEGFAHTGEARADILSITAVHPMREVAVRELLEKDGAGWDVVEALLASGELETVDQGGELFYLRPLPNPPSRTRG